MRTTNPVASTALRLGALALAAAAAVSCGIEKQSAPALAGPSEFSTSITMTAHPDQLRQDGASHSEIRILVLDENARPLPGLTLQFEAVDQASFQPLGTLTASSGTTDVNGRAAIGL